MAGTAYSTRNVMVDAKTAYIITMREALRRAKAIELEKCFNDMKAKMHSQQKQPPE